jgi:hypothetical protein
MMLRGTAVIASHGDKLLDQQAKLKMLGFMRLPASTKPLRSVGSNRDQSKASEG